jgi:hypothetical protein
VKGIRKISLKDRKGANQDQRKIDRYPEVVTPRLKEKSLIGKWINQRDLSLARDE